MALKNSFLRGYELQSMGTITEGTVPVPPDRPCAYEIVMEDLFRESQVGGAHSGGGKNPW
jgi:hypothetical protein